jgi:hypothetical protein
VLGTVAEACHARGEPLLSALCVHADGTVGPGYATALANAYGIEITERDIRGWRQKNLFAALGSSVPTSRLRVAAPQLPLSDSRSANA